MHIGLGAPPVHEQASREQDRAWDARVQTPLGDGLAGSLGVFGRSAEVQPVLKRIYYGPDEGANGDCKLNHAGLKGIEAVVCAESLHDGREEEEEDAPGETDPESEEYDDGLGQQHLGGAHEGYFEELGNVGLFELGFGVDGASGFFAKLLGTLFKDDVAAGLREDQVEDGDQCRVVYYLDVEDPGRISEVSRLFEGSVTIATVVRDPCWVCESAR